MPRVSRRQAGLIVIGGALVAAVVVYVSATYGGDDPHAGSAESGPAKSAAGDKPADDDYGASAAGCPVTKGGIGQDGLRVSFGREATIVASPGEGGAPPGTTIGQVRADGSIGAKIPWFRDRRAWGRLRVSAIRRPGGDRLLRALYDNHLGPRSRVVPGAMVFPRGGCWRVRARSGSAELAAVIWIVNIAEV